jgi:hypothetical protein
MDNLFSMKKGNVRGVPNFHQHCLLWGAILLFSISIQAQTPSTADSLDEKSVWEISAEANMYFLQDDFYVIPVITIDKGTLHLETRYNYEDFKTASVWGGFNFWGGKKWQWKITPMAGVVFGNTNGIAPGVEVDLNWKGFEFYSEGEWLINFDFKEDNYLYLWSDLSYSPVDWLYFGISGQRLRTFDSELDIQRGIFTGFTYKWANLTGYWYNIGSSDSFFMLSAGISF